MNPEAEAPGRAALDEAMARAHGRPPDLVYATPEEPLESVSVYRLESPRPHWHLVGAGLSELDEKETDEPEMSGFGFELTLRVPVSINGRAEEEPPLFAVELLQELARYVVDTHNVLDVGHQLHLGGPLSRSDETRLEAVLIARDPELPRIATPFGRVDFLQAVGITGDEHELVKDWGAEPLLEVLAGVLPVSWTDLRRPSLLADPGRAAELRARVARDGSSLGGVFVAHATFARRGERTTLELGASAVDDLLRLLKGRTAFGREFFVKGEDAVVWIEPGARPSLRIDGDALRLTLDKASAEKLRATLKPQRGRYSLPPLPELAIEVVPSQIRDRQGKVVRVVG